MLKIILMKFIRTARKSDYSMKIRSIVTLSLSVLFAGGVFAGADNMKAIDAYSSGNYQTAIELFLPSAEDGDATAQLYLGWIYEGEGVLRDESRAFYWYRTLAEQGDEKGAYNLGRMHELGMGATRDLILAQMWYNVSALIGEQSLSDAVSLAGYMTSEEMLSAESLSIQCVAQDYKDCGY